MNVLVQSLRQFIFQRLMVITGSVKARGLIIRVQKSNAYCFRRYRSQIRNGDRGFAFSSGMAAIQVLMNLFKGPDEWIVSSDVYGGTYRLLDFAYKNNNSVKPVYVE